MVMVSAIANAPESEIESREDGGELLNLAALKDCARVINLSDECTTLPLYELQEQSEVR